ncbi:MAG: MBOAT family protein [Clostridia bacterium]|nr:MBOAT family protein [Clostridia bacterium]
MLFCSIPFIYYFFPCTLLLYLIAPKQLKNSVLLLSSLVFYWWGEPRYVFLMLAAILLGYVFGLLIEKFKDRWQSKLFLILSVASSLGMLGYYKYADFFIQNFNAATGLSVPLLNIALPIGISFYTFQILSYTVDVYRGDVAAQKNPINLGAYIAMFPQLIAGPIVRYRDVEHQLTDRKLTIERTAIGIRRFIFGFAKKILIANSLGELCDIFGTSTDRSVMFCWLYAVSYALQVYFDFSGYSDMAIGLGKILGFEFMENFNYPYISASITEFWRRWHISLGSWFRDYVYIPLGGNRVSKLRWLRNIFIVWFLTGFWHGAAWNFIVWGLYFAVMLLIEKLWLLKYLQKSKVLNHLYVLFFVIISFVIFNASSMSDAVVCIGNMFGFGGVPFVSAQWLYYLRSYAVILIIAAIGATPLAAKAVSRLKETKSLGKWVNIAEPVVLLILLVVSTAYLVDGSFNPFLYFRF